MKILVISSVHIWNDNRIFHKEISVLSKIHSVELHAVAPFDHKRVNNVDIYGVKVATLKIGRLLNLIRLYRRVIRSNCDVVHFHDFELLFVCTALKLRTRKIFIYDCHEYFSKVALSRDWVPPLFKRSLRWFISLIEPILASYMDYTIIANSSSKEAFSHKVAIIRNFPKISKSVKRPSQGKKQNTEIIYVGDITVDRGIWQMLTTIRALSIMRGDFHFRLVGRISSAKLHRQINIFIEENQLTSYISYHGYLDYSKVSEFLNDADIGLCLFANTMRQDVLLPTKALDYMAHEVAFIVDPLPELKTLLESTKCCFYRDPSNSSSCVDLLEYLMDNRNELDRMATAGRQLVNAGLNWNEEGKKLIALYESIEAKQ